MTVYVDEVRRWPTTIRCFQAGSAHLTADTLEELHELARAIGLKRAWFQNERVPHYDLTPSRREAALRAGAVFVSAKEQARGRVAARAAAHEATASTVRALKSPSAVAHVEALECARDAAVRRIDDWVERLDALDPDEATNNEDIYDELVRLRDAVAPRGHSCVVLKGPSAGHPTLRSVVSSTSDPWGRIPDRLRMGLDARAEALLRLAADAKPPTARARRLCPGSRNTFDHVRGSTSGGHPWERACGVCGHLGEPA